MSRRYGDSMREWEREQDEKDWKRRCQLAIENNNRDKIQFLIEEGVENDYDSSMILKLEEL